MQNLCKTHCVLCSNWATASVKKWPPRHEPAALTSSFNYFFESFPTSRWKYTFSFHSWTPTFYAKSYEVLCTNKPKFIFHTEYLRTFKLVGQCNTQPKTLNNTIFSCVDTRNLCKNATFYAEMAVPQWSISTLSPIRSPSDPQIWSSWRKCCSQPRFRGFSVFPWSFMHQPTLAGCHAKQEPFGSSTLISNIFLEFRYFR